MATPGMQNPMLKRFTLAVAILLLLASAGVIVAGSLMIAQQMTPRGLALIAVGAAVLGVGALLVIQTTLSYKQVSNTYRTYSVTLEMLDELRRQTQHVNTIAENTSLSDWAKQIVYREKDFEFLRDMIHGAVVRQDRESAEHLINEMEQTLGRRDEAQRLRDELTRISQASVTEQIDAAIQRFETLCEAQRWRQARDEAQRLQERYPNNDRVAGLLQKADVKRQEHKRRLLKEYDRAVQLEDMDRAHELLLELDKYLTTNEAAALKDSARGVFRARLMQMGVQFSLCVSEKKYQEAINIGQKLMREFPNSRYAHEIADMMPTLRHRIAAG